MADLKRWKITSKKDYFYYFFEQSLWGTIFYRISRALFLINVPILKFFTRLLGFFVFKFSDVFLGVGIRPGADIGPGLYVGHSGLVMIIEDAKIGKNFSIGSDLLVGRRGGGHAGSPTIGDNVSVGAGAKILGKITIGDNVRIGANSLVVQSVESNLTVLGVPAKVIGPAFNYKK